MLLEDRINAFAKLGQFLSQYTRDAFEQKEDVLFNELFFDPFKLQIKRAHEYNGWFNKENVLFAIESWSKQLTNNNLTNWSSTYTLNTKNTKVVAIIMAGNIPLVGFHDFISVLLSGNAVLVRQSSNDRHFLPLIVKYLEHIEPEFRELIKISDEKLSGFDAAIATGSTNTSRYFEYYFGAYPHIIRNNRNSVAVLSGNESLADLKGLGVDIFQYFGLGCRSVSKLFVPKGYDFDQLFKAIYDHKDIINYKKYENNYDYNKAVYLMSEFKLLENGFLMLKEDKSYASPIATLFYEYYEDLDLLKIKLENDKNNIQCVVSTLIEGAVSFGKTQEPQLTEYADGVDTMAFLSAL